MKFILALCSVFLSFNLQAHEGHPPMDPHGSTADLVFLNGNIHAQATWLAGPTLSPQESLLQLQWRNGADHSATNVPGAFAVELWMEMPGMPGHGHGSAPTKIQQILDAKNQSIVGLYNVSNIYFVMAGTWQVKITLKNQDGSQETQVMQVQVGGTGDGHQHH